MKRRRTRQTFSYRVVLTPAEEGGYVATVPALPGCVSEGDSYEDAMRNIREAIHGYIEVCREFDDPIPPSDIIETVVKVAV